MTKQTAQVAEAEEKPPALPKINQQWVSKNYNGCFEWREFMVYLPDRVWLSELRENPSLWSLVQMVSDVALRQFDIVRMVSFDRTRLATATVVYADQFTAELDTKGAQRSVVDLPAPVLRENKVARVIVTGPSYAVERRSDGVIVGKALTLAEANKKADSLEPKPVPR